MFAFWCEKLSQSFLCFVFLGEFRAELAQTEESKKTSLTHSTGQVGEYMMEGSISRTNSELSLKGSLVVSSPLRLR